MRCAPQAKIDHPKKPKICAFWALRVFTLGAKRKSPKGVLFKTKITMQLLNFFQQRCDTF
ncbi:hypothetical protein HanXRQr2_Chr16g0760491 [Helianthus annuus]|uniref:Uncharacterized protein n=1 Tax=Helianthus annuus TaxID=4232 RepID=A0A9K3DVH2_HELAN|nr:hypothetical protein HanXRQr2_Chr16g0760491 [Helianthus annuus]KAJ0822161.1 hypothetical protein HanPSC8_Chr16g0728711 [Helianthus annuus]